MFCLVAAHCASGCGHGHCPNTVCTVCMHTYAYYVHMYSFLPGIHFDACSQSHEYVVEMVKSHIVIVRICHSHTAFMTSCKF